jgi:hypothetical protein
MQANEKYPKNGVLFVVDLTGQNSNFCQIHGLVSNSEKSEIAKLASQLRNLPWPLQQLFEKLN